MKKVLVSNCLKYQRGKLIGEIFPKMKNGLFLSRGKEHAWQRKVLNPFFSSTSVLEYVQTFDTNTENLIKVGLIQNEIFSQFIINTITMIVLMSHGQMWLFEAGYILPFQKGCCEVREELIVCLPKVTGLNP